MDDPNSLPPESEPHKPELKRFIRASEVPRRPIEWIWEHLIPRTYLSILTGYQQSGKTLTALQLAASVTRGARVPIPTRGPVPLPPKTELLSIPTAFRTTPGDALICGTNASLWEDLKSNLEISGVDSRHLSILTESDCYFNGQSVQIAPEFVGIKQRPWERQLSRIENFANHLLEEKADLRLIVIDPLEQLLTQKTSRADRIQIARRLKQLATWSGAAVVTTANLELERQLETGFIGLSPAFDKAVAASRAILNIDLDPGQPDQRLITVEKMNLGPALQPFYLRFFPTDGEDYRGEMYRRALYECGN